MYINICIYTYRHMCVYSNFLPWGWRDGSAVKNTVSTQVGFPAPMSSDSKLLVTPGDPKPSFGFHWHCTQMCMCAHTHAHSLCLFLLCFVLLFNHFSLLSFCYCSVLFLHSISHSGFLDITFSTLFSKL